MNSIKEALKCGMYGGSLILLIVVIITTLRLGDAAYDVITDHTYSCPCKCARPF